MLLHFTFFRDSTNKSNLFFLLFMIMVVGLLNGIVTSSIVFFTSNKQSYKWVSLAVLFFSLSTIREFIHFFESSIDLHLSFVHLFYFKLLIPPCLLIASDGKYSSLHLKFLLPGIFSFFGMLFFNFSFLSELEFVGNFIPIATDVFAFLWLLYLFNNQTFKQNKKSELYSLKVLILIGLFIVFLTRVLQFFAVFQPASWLYDSVFSFRVISISILVYFLSLVLLNGVFTFKKLKQSLSNFISQDIQPQNVERVKNQELISRLNALMIDEELFRNPKLKSSDVAEKLGISVHQFSEIINIGLQKNFSSFVNAYRINYAKSLLQENTSFTIEGIGKESGFNSKSTFYTAFKKATGTSPAHFKRSKTSAEL